MFKIDIRNENLSSIFVQYEVFDTNTLSKINLKICENFSIFINIPLNLESDAESLYDDLCKRGYNLFNPLDDFYINPKMEPMSFYLIEETHFLKILVYAKKAANLYLIIPL